MVAKGRFGAFGGVFTPAILTILGVIMYMRLPWIVGQSGLLYSLAIITLAHVISLTTGLSVSSIATDKRVRTGGSYYILSRSLGLPIGGTLGIALFIGLSFSISLYLIGFSESFLDFLGMERSPDGIRIIGTATLAAVTVLTLISTSLAIKTQFVIMGLIVLSLGSILLGGGGTTPAAPHTQPISGAVPLAVLFGIFFPAVTGFEAGVSMSGDLKDPKRDIPRGSLSAIVVGFVVYVLLAFFFAYRVDPEQLATNSGVLLSIALYPALVVAGIWGATLSSALGSLMGAPRILQACAADRIAPRVFAKGSGRDNEPRRALLLTFVIAEAGILVGELDVIARVVSMFFIASYGFLNLSCAIESWVSPDFQPEFRIPRSVSVVGAVCCFFTMLQIDPIAMLASVILLAGLFATLKRKELVLESGDTWYGVWWSMVQTALTRLRKTALHPRNWRPYLLAFVSEPEERQSLAQLTGWITHRRGMASVFEVIESDQPQLAAADLLDKDTESPTDAVRQMRIECRDAVETMISLVRFHGVSGMTPNSVLMNWRWLSQHGETTSPLLRALDELNHSVLVTSLAPTAPLERRHRVDIWSAEAGSDLALSLSIVRYLKSTTAWRDASINFLTVARNRVHADFLERRLAGWLEDGRLDATVRAYPHRDNQSWIPLIAEESSAADLVLLGLGKAARIGGIDAATQHLLDNPPTSILLLQPASTFEIPFVSTMPDETPGKTSIGSGDALGELPALELPDNQVLRDHVVDFHVAIRVPLLRFMHETVSRLHDRYDAMTEKIIATLESTTLKVMTARGPDQDPRTRRLISKSRADLRRQLEQVLSDLRDEGLKEERTRYEHGIEALLRQFSVLRSEDTPSTLEWILDEEAIAADPADSLSLRVFKRKRRLVALLRRREISCSIPLQAHVRGLMESSTVPVLAAALRDLDRRRRMLLMDLERGVKWGWSVLDHQMAYQLGLAPPEQDEHWEAELNERLAQIRQRTARLDEQARKMVDEVGLLSAQDLSLRLSSLGSARRVRGQRRALKHGAEVRKTMAYDHDLAWDAEQHLIDQMGDQIQLRIFHERMQGNLARALLQVHTEVDEGSYAQLSELRDRLNALGSPGDDGRAASIQTLGRRLVHLDVRDILTKLLEQAADAMGSLPETVETWNERSLAALEEEQLTDLDLLQLNLRQLVTYLVEHLVMDSLEPALETLQGAVAIAIDETKDVVRLSAMALEPADKDEELELETTALMDVVNHAAERVERVRIDIEQAQMLVIEVFQLMGTELLDRVDLRMMAASTGEFTQFLRSHGGQKVLNTLSRRLTNLARGMVQQLNALPYRWSSGQLLARRLQTSATVLSSRVERLRAFSQTVSVSSTIRTSLPVHYAHLFLGSAPIPEAYWVGREHELALAAEALESERPEGGGAIVVAGSPRVGASSLARRILRRTFRRDRIFDLVPPANGSAEPTVFFAALQRALDTQQPVARALDSLPPESAIFVHDLSLWWERSEHGCRVIEELQKLIERHGERVTFVITVQECTYGFLRKLGYLDGHVCTTITCPPLDAQALHDVVMLRHRATGLELYLSGRRHLDSSGQWRLARLFARIFAQSHGHVGVALHAWLALVSSATDRRIEMHPPTLLRSDRFEALTPAWAALLVDLLMHRQMDLGRLSRVTGMDSELLHEDLRALSRCGLIRGLDRGVFEIDPFVRPYVAQWLTERGVV